MRFLQSAAWQRVVVAWCALSECPVLKSKNLFCQKLTNQCPVRDCMILKSNEFVKLSTLRLLGVHIVGLCAELPGRADNFLPAPAGRAWQHNDSATRRLTVAAPSNRAVARASASLSYGD